MLQHMQSMQQFRVTVSLAGQDQCSVSLLVIVAGHGAQGGGSKGVPPLGTRGPCAPLYDAPCSGWCAPCTGVLTLYCTDAAADTACTTAMIMSKVGTHEADYPEPLVAH